MLFTLVMFRRICIRHYDGNLRRMVVPKEKPPWSMSRTHRPSAPSQSPLTGLDLSDNEQPQAVVCSILPYGCETWHVRVAKERVSEVFENDSIHCILHLKRRDCVPSVKLRCRLCLTSMPALLVQRRLRWIGHAARHPEGEMIKDLLLPKPPCTRRRRTGNQMKTWKTTIRSDLEPFSASQVFAYAHGKRTG